MFYFEIDALEKARKKADYANYSISNDERRGRGKRQLQFDDYNCDDSTDDDYGNNIKVTIVYDYFIKINCFPCRASSNGIISTEKSKIF